MTREQAIRQILDEMPYATIRGSGESVTVRRELLLVAFGYLYPIDEQRITPNLRESDLEPSCEK